jgi:hypothetical protein
MKRIAVLATLCVGSAALAVEPVTYDALADFSTTSNPTGPWAYGHANVLTGVMAIHPNFFTTGGGVQVWNDPAFHNSGAPSMWRSSDATSLGFHPGQMETDSYSLIRFTVPTDGRADITASFLALDPANYNKDVFVFHNGAELFRANVNGSTAADPIPGNAASAALTEAVSAGDYLYVGVGRGPDNNYYDATGVSFNIVLSVPEPASLSLLGLGGLALLRRRRA